MKHHLRLILLAVGTLVLAGQRMATAGPCKADGERCRTSRSCCGTSGNNGMCLGGGSKVGFGVCCTPTECDPAIDCGDVSNGCGGTNLCLAGGLFYNSYFNTLLARSDLYSNTFVPANPGNAGVAIGAALLASQRPIHRQPCSTSPFLGPGFTPEEIKATLDNCKLSYDYLSNGRLLDQTTAALVKGELVGWFHGRMEWGVRALGNRSILASPTAPYVLENLNRFLKQRDPHRTYSVAVCAEDASRFFCGPPASPLMEYEYEVLDRVLFRHLLPDNATRLRVQTVDASAGAFYDLLRAFGDLTGVPVLVNTSFNGFNEPIVCHPRDAVRVFYGTGLDMAVLDSLVLRK